MDKLRSMAVFVAVADTGSFAAAAQAQHLSAVMVGKHIRQLEEHLGARLLQRDTRKQRLTEVGVAFLDEARLILEQVRRADTVAERLRDDRRPSGHLRVTAPLTLGGAAIAPVITQFLRIYPEVSLDLALADRMSDLIAEAFDAAIRIGPLPDSDHLIARPLRPYRMTVCASPDYLRERGTPTDPRELVDHSCLNHLLWHRDAGWRFGSIGPEPLRLSGRFASNHGEALRRAALDGCGIVLQPEVLLADDIAAGRLVRLFEHDLPPPRPVHLLYPRDRQPLPKLSRFIEFVLERLGPEV
ncbi:MULTISPECIES: LysR family transcriptional regulator [Lysobacter]|uniref:LysR family transcriptional regulator n=1 Tax=Lysobacter gummosus TaxID=262324 RepID=A0ABY3XFU3_9GAMM|nr:MULTISPECIES: LysR family transcriptional regulator [Lysobacter]ALN89918.1 bacterial regulatory helix-turn-helix, lysR family protein [Lysobacter gummosus]UJB18212.1 LysR family transcriptional regulator [Lysobacter capsici]UJQ28065.1 LysR family transcriptional regulator [Lysobacter gummosus]UNP30507.1 LysR family transcriptional regulator [Lysobacter gummosus]